MTSSTSPSRAGEGGTVPRLDWRTLIHIGPEAPADIVAALDRYFEPFVQPPFTIAEDGKTDLGHHLCLKCEKPLLGLTAFLLGGGFTWGLAHGEGFCRECRWPARAHHFIKDDSGKDIASLRNFVLQYHPDFVTAKKRQAAS